MQIEKFELEEWMNQHELNVKFDIAESGIAPLPVHELLNYSGDNKEDLLKTLTDTPVSYHDVQGALPLRQELARTYENCGPENILITVGASEANFLLFNALLGAGDHVIAPLPAWQQLYSIPKALGCDVSFWHCRAENNFKFDLAELRKLMRPDTKMIVVNNPHNPTGAVFTRAELSEIYAMAESVGATVLSDEAYRWLNVPGSTFELTPAFNSSKSAASVGTMSKPFGLPGLRIGWIAAQPKLIQRCRSLRQFITLYAGRLDEILARIALQQKEQIITRNEKMISQNLECLKSWAEKHPDVLSYQTPAAGLLTMLRYKLDIPSVEFADKLAQQYSVMLAPGAVFGLEGYLRLGFGQHPDIFAQGVAAADKCIEDLLSKGRSMAAAAKAIE